MRRKDTHKKGNNKENPCFFDEKQQTLTPVSAQKKGSKKGSINKKSYAERILRRIVVELEGFEPSSKQGVSALSTCLFQPGLSGVAKTWTTKRHLSL